MGQGSPPQNKQETMKDFRVELLNAAAQQGVTLSEQEIEHLFNIADIVRDNKRLIWRSSAFKRAGYEVAQKPMHTGFGKVLCMKRMKNGALRVRVSANWGGKQCNYAWCVEI